MRIAHVLNEVFEPEAANGVQQMAYCLARAQADAGHAVAVFSRSGGTRVLGCGPRPAGGPAPATGRLPRSLRSRLLSRYLDAARARAIHSFAPDVVHFHSVHIPEHVALADYLSAAAIPYCVTSHGALFPAALRRGRVKKHAFAWAFERAFLRRAGFIHAVSPDETEAIRAQGVERPVVVAPNALPPDARTVPRHPDLLRTEHPHLRNRRVLMFIGRLDTWQKGLDILLAGLAAARLNRTSLVLVGPAYKDSEQALKHMARRLGIASQVLFLPPAFGERRADLLAGSDVFVHPSRWEGLSLSVLTAAAAGKPCLLSRAADPMGQLERAGAAIIASVTVRSVEAALARVEHLRADELATMGARARAVAESQDSWSDIAQRLVSGYEHALVGDPVEE